MAIVDKLNSQRSLKCDKYIIETILVMLTYNYNKYNLNIKAKCHDHSNGSKYW